MKYTLGCDPGLNGALCLYRAEPLDIIFLDMPCHEITVNGKKKKRLDVYELARFIDVHSANIGKAWIEEVWTSPQMGVTSAGAFMETNGIVKGVIAANFIPMELVKPQAWKKHFGLHKDKDESRRKCSAMFPLYSGQWSRARDDGRAEALLIAVYGNIK